MRFVSGKEKRKWEQEQIERTYGLSVRPTLSRVIYFLNQLRRSVCRVRRVVSETGQQFRAKPAVLATFAKRVRRSETRTGLAGRKDSRARKTRSIGAKEKAYKKKGGGQKLQGRNRSARSLRFLARCEKIETQRFRDWFRTSALGRSHWLKSGFTPLRNWKLKRFVLRIKRERDYQLPATDLCAKRTNIC